MLLVVFTAIAIASLCGCSNSSRELRTPAEADGFVAEVASGEPYGEWKLANGASLQAAQAWAARATIGDLGRRLQNAAKLETPGNATWTCEMARNLVGLGAVSEVTSFDSFDVEAVTREAVKLGYKRDEIAAMTHDASTVPFRDLAIATAVVCGPKVS
ncbi:MAG TPA: hypothetical protein VHY18_05395 [Solirubrobacteraceae bacterium]|nr:hypothetical protein [Solirubrobacteraceae bacterium]